MTKLRYQITTMCSLANFDFSLEEMKTYKDQFSTMKINTAVTYYSYQHIVQRICTSFWENHALYDDSTTLSKLIYSI